MKQIVVLTALALVTSASAAPTGGNVVALVTSEQQNEVIAVELSSGKVLRRASVPKDPQNVATGQFKIIVVSSAAGAVSLLDWRTLEPLKVFRNFAAPHIASVDPLRTIAYVTDDARGELSVIGLGAKRVVGRVFVGAGAHHMALGPGGHRLWIALGERASRIAIVDVTKTSRPWLVRRVSLPFVAHDLTFSRDGRHVWVTSAVGESVHVLDARTGKEAFAVHVGAGPQHVAFSDRGDMAYATSGYSSRIVQIDPASGRIRRSARTPYGSFNLSAFGDFVVTTSLMNGRLTEFDNRLHRVASARPARAARAVAVTVWP